MAELFHAIHMTGWATALRESALVYPVILILHLTCIAIFGGLIFATDLRLLGVAFRQAPMREVIDRLRPWKQGGFVVMVTCGILLAASKADEYYPNPYFRIKLLLLAMVGVHALVFRKSVYRATGEPNPAKARWAAIFSMALWLGVLSMGRWLAYYELKK
jgi:hypothetical protein